jgi:hypothetical protein
VKTVSVRAAGGVTAVSLDCPRGAVALNGAAVALGKGAVVRDNEPVTNSSTRWNFRFTARGNGGRRARAVLRCVRLALPPGTGQARLNVLTANTGYEPVAAGSSKRIALSCDRGFIPTGWGIDRQGQGAASQRLRVAVAQPTANGWTFTVANPGGVQARARLHIRCVERRQTATSGRHHAFVIRRSTFNERGRGKSVSHSCRPGDFSVSTGFSLDPGGSIGVSSTEPFATRGGRWRFDLSPARNRPVKTYLLCLDRDTRFG